MNTQNTALTWLRTHAAVSDAIASQVHTLAKLCKATPRMSLQQLAIFLWIAQQDIEGAPVSFVDVREEFKDFGKSVHTTYKAWLAPSTEFPKAMGWIETRPDPTDGRRKTLHLSAKGAVALAAVLRKD